MQTKCARCDQPMRFDSEGSTHIDEDIDEKHSPIEAHNLKEES